MSPSPDPKTKNRLHALEKLRFLDELRDSKAFQWFTREVLEKHRDEEHTKALAYPGKPDECEQARHRHDLARAICEAPARLRKANENLAKPD